MVSNLKRTIGEVRFLVNSFGGYICFGWLATDFGYLSDVMRYLTLAGSGNRNFPDLET